MTFLVNYYLYLADKGNIEFIVSGKLTETMDLEMFDITTLMGNILQNAMEATIKAVVPKIRVELVEHNIEIFQKKNSNVKIHQGNALDLSMFKDESFSVTLLFGPMYHLLSKEEKLQALKEAKRVTKKDGFIFVSYYMNEYAIISYGFITIGNECRNKMQCGG